MAKSLVDLWNHMSLIYFGSRSTTAGALALRIDQRWIQSRNLSWRSSNNIVGNKYDLQELGGGGACMHFGWQERGREWVGRGERKYGRVVGKR
jgi:hypothetical protein